MSAKLVKVAWGDLERGEDEQKSSESIRKVGCSVCQDEIEVIENQKQSLPNVDRSEKNVYGQQQQYDHDHS